MVRIKLEFSVYILFFKLKAIEVSEKKSIEFLCSYVDNMIVITYSCFKTIFFHILREGWLDVTALVFLKKS